MHRPAYDPVLPRDAASRCPKPHRSGAALTYAAATRTRVGVVGRTLLARHIGTGQLNPGAAAVEQAADDLVGGLSTPSGCGT